MNYSNALLAICSSLGLSLSAQTPVDTVSLLPAATVRGFRDEAPKGRVAASIATLGTREIQRFGQESILPAMNLIPGVRFEQRAPGSYRISVRGSTLRSPFGVRNIKVYWNDIPFTQPGGDTPFNFLDLVNIDRVELIKGPAGSLYGAGTAGTLVLGTSQLADTSAVEYTRGSYGLQRLSGKLQLPAGKSTYQLRFATQNSDGYRDHSAFSRQVVQLSNRIEQSGRSNLELHALYTKLNYELPGGLNPEQYAEDPTQARPGSAETNASIAYDNLLIGATQEFRRGRILSRTTLYGTFFKFDNPFNVDYKRETNIGGGGRTVLDYSLPFATSVLKLSGGAEVQTQYRAARNYGNVSGDPGDLNFSDDISSNQATLFAQAAYAFGDAWKLTAGLSTNGLSYDVDRTFDANANVERTVSDFRWVTSPRIALLKGIGSVSVFGSVSSGFSPPTLTEFRTNEGSINTNLAPERGISYELGVKSRRAGRLSYEATAFNFRLDETITTFTDARGTQLFRNAGNTSQWGLELSGEWLAVPGRVTGAIRRLSVYGSYTYHDFTYGEYETGGENFASNRLPGTAPHVVNLAINAGLPAGFYLNLNGNYTDAIPLDDANTVYGEAYTLLRARLGFATRLGSKTGLDIYLGGNNLLNQTFSLGNDLNPQFGRRYFQPADDRTWFVGIKFSR